MINKTLNIKTQEITEKNLSIKELELFEIAKKASEQESIKNEKAKARQLGLKESANAKLLALGLSPEEVAAITGA